MRLSSHTSPTLVYPFHPPSQCQRHSQLHQIEAINLRTKHREKLVAAYQVIVVLPKFFYFLLRLRGDSRNLLTIVIDLDIVSLYDEVNVCPIVFSFTKCFPSALDTTLKEISQA